MLFAKSLRNVAKCQNTFLTENNYKFTSAVIGIRLKIFIPVTRRVKGCTRLVGKYVTGTKKRSDPIKYIYS